MRIRFGPGLIGVILMIVAVVALVLHFGFGLFGDAVTTAPPVQPAAEPAAAPDPEPAAEPAPEIPVRRVVYESPLAGRWFPASRERLEEDIRGYLEKADTDTLVDVQALILPHAGYRYSGQTAAYGIKQIAGQTFRRVVVLGPSHRLSMENVASVPDATHYATPLGEIPLDLAFVKALRRHPQFQTIPQAHDGEHSVQIEVPLLQEALGEFDLVPIVIGQLDKAAARRIGEILASVVDEETLVVASSDFTHYGENFGYYPFRDDVPENLRKLDMAAYEPIGEKSVDGFYEFLDETGCTVCGRNPIAVLLSMLPAESEAHFLRYDTSGAITNDYSSSVSYLTVAFTGSWNRGDAVAPAAEAELGEEEQTRLLDLARKTVVYALEHRRMPEPGDLGVEITPGMEAIRGAFVTLEKEGNLRGCIGDIFPQRPLYRSVIQNAIHAALNDRRFRPVTADEVASLHIEISVLTPQREIASYEEIEVGRHGVVLQKDGRRAVFLPQVAPEQGWDRDTMLRALSRKAGLDEEAWREGATFTVFEARVFGEEEG